MKGLHAARLASAVVLAVAVGACSSDGGAPAGPEGPGDTAEFTIDIDQLFGLTLRAEAPAQGLRQGAQGGDGLTPVADPAVFLMADITKIKLTVYEVPSGTILFQKTYDVNPAGPWRLSFTAPANANVRLVAELMSVTSGVTTVERSGQAGPVKLVPCTSNCQPIRIPTHPGPAENLGATAVVVTPATATLEVGGTTNLTATPTPAGSYQPVWTSLESAVASVTGTGLVTGLAQGTARIVVAVGATRDTAVVTVTLPPPPPPPTPAQLVVQAGDGQSATVGAAVPVAPAVLVRAAGGAPLAGIAVTFEVTSGGGTVTGASATSDAQGVATVGGWTLGAAAGAQTLTARVGNLSVVFTATATPASTCVAQAITLGTSVFGVWQATDCTAEGRVHDPFTLALTAQTVVQGTLSAAATPKTLGAFLNGGEVVNYQRTPEGDLVANWFLAPGSYEFRAGAPTTFVGGNYSMTLAEGSASIGCASNATTGNIALSGQTLASGDCTFGARFEDRLVLYVEAGRQIVLEMTGDAGPAAIIRDPLTPAGTFLVRQARSTAGSVTATWTAQHTGYYMVIFGTDQENVALAYSGSITVQ